MATAQPVSQPAQRGVPVSSNVQQAVSPPSKEQLKSWWTKFGRRKDKQEDQVPVNQGIFGIPLDQSILYANVAISLTNEQGESFIYGYVPIVVAKCGVFLKEKATDVEGIFRLSGSAKRIKDLQVIFNSPERYGKGLDWTGYTVHDAANILRRYLNQLPEPIVPLDFYERFRDPLRAYQANQAQVANKTQPQAMEHEEHARAVAAYQKLITELPALNRQLLLYILDLLAVFASKSDLNRMTAQNLAAIFQPGIISHPNHDMAPNEYRLSQDVLIFLIENQDNFLIGMTGTAMDDKMKDTVKSGPPSIKTPKATTIQRSASSASAGADSLRKTGGVRRNASMSSRNSRDRSSPGVSAPGTPISPSGLGGSAGSAGGLGRSNTLPSKRSPALPQHRFQKVSEASQPSSPIAVATTPFVTSPTNELPPTESVQNLSPIYGTDIRLPVTQPFHTAQPAVLETNQLSDSTSSVTAAQDFRPAQESIAGASVNGKPARDRKISNLLSVSPLFGPYDQQRDPTQRQPRKLQKRRIPGSSNESAQSSQASLNPADDATAFHTPLMTPTNQYERQLSIEHQNYHMPNTITTPTSEYPPDIINTLSPIHRDPRIQGQGLMPPQSPTLSTNSRGSVTDPSDLDALEDPALRDEKTRRRFRLSRAGDSPLVPPPLIGQNPGARTSNSSLGSSRPRKSYTGDSQHTQTSNMDSSSTGYPSAMNVSSRESSELLKESQQEGEKKGFFGRIKAKISQSKEDRAKSPPRLQPLEGNSRQSLTAFAHEHLSPRGRSFDRPREEPFSTVQGRSGNERSGSKTPVPPYPVQYAQASAATSASAPISAAPPQAQAQAQEQAQASAGPQAPDSALAAAPTIAPFTESAPGYVPISTSGAIPSATLTDHGTETGGASGSAIEIPVRTQTEPAGQQDIISLHENVPDQTTANQRAQTDPAQLHASTVYQESAPNDITTVQMRPRASTGRSVEAPYQAPQQAHFGEADYAMEPAPRSGGTTELVTPGKEEEQEKQEKQDYQAS